MVVLLVDCKEARIIHSSFFTIQNLKEIADKFKWRFLPLLGSLSIHLMNLGS
jgi:hypothetical protein